ncbi:MAG: cell wall metabolism sensor histidine kinase WalK, partial [Delftia sp.]|nr:cell wall metabolism sensor histidine kinase WalK [Delftia sp.]
MFSSIRVRLTLSHLAVIVMAMGLSGFLLLSFLERYFLQSMEDSLAAQARITAQALIPGAMAEGLPIEAPPDANLAASNAVQQQQWSNLVLQTDNVALPADALSPDGVAYLADASLPLSAQLDTHIRILDEQGLVLVDSRQEEQSADLRTDPLVARALEGQYASRVSGGVMRLALPAQTEERLVGVVYLSQPLHDVTAVLYDLRARWLLSTAIALLFSGAAGLLLARAIASPLRRLTEAAGAVAQGQFDQQVPAGSRDELGRLSRAFNDMTARLRAARQM